MDLERAGISKKPRDFIKKNMLAASYFTFGILLICFFMFSKFELPLFFLLVLIPVLYPVMFMYMLKTPALKIAKKRRDIDAEVLFAGRYLLIEFWSGVPIFDSFVSVSKNYGTISDSFKEIVEMVEAGVSLEDAIDQAIELSPSPRLRKLLWQIVNSLKTGSDISDSLEIILNQIEREQLIEVKGYGRKLNSLALFYMMIAVILPALGGIMLVVVSSFTGLQVTLSVLLMAVGALAFIQLMFVNVIKQSRPSVAE
ncbi:type II secretion system F family protein [Candidatus Woesearchaeota archaeon]|nr:type II secretion system F family protein [Candidatus Woesearchaeota archaeon]